MPTPLATQDICGACGLCCDGTLFREVVVSESEAERLRGLALPIVGEAPSGLQQRCRAHRGSSCSIYEGRPTSCVDFQCSLLRRYVDGAVTERDAVEKIEKIKRLASEIRDKLEFEMGVSFGELLTIIRARATGGAWCRANAEVLLALKCLEVLIQTEIRPLQISNPERSWAGE